MDYGNLKSLVGKTITSIERSDDGQYLRFNTTTEPVCYQTEADCCSYTWIEHLSGFDALIGSLVISVENVDLPEPPDADADKHDVLAFYGLRITTTRGYCDIDYRNDSNGYYGGSLSACHVTPDATFNVVKDDF